jgi:hypothetical protein
MMHRMSPRRTAFQLFLVAVLLGGLAPAPSLGQDEGEEAAESSSAKGFLMFVNRFQEAMTNGEGEWLLAHVQFPLVHLQRKVMVNPDQSHKLVGDTSVRQIQREEWAVVEQCGDEKMAVLGWKSYPDTPGWQCDLLYRPTGMRTVKSLELTPDPYQFQLVSSGFSLRSTKRTDGYRFVFDYLDGQWWLRRVEEIIYPVF